MVIEWGSVPSAVVVTSLLLWLTMLVFFGATLFWLYETLVVAWLRTPAPLVYGPADVQVRIATVDNAAVVRHTVESLPPELTDVHVIAERPIHVAGATVHVVPEEFECLAERKGRAMEWARRTLACDREFVLYLDEDTVVRNFEGLPDADVVQFSERPVRTESRLAYLAELFRMGFQVEQRAFSGLQVPLYAWGGGIAVRARVEDEVTWDRRSLVEDTAFVWAALLGTERTFAFVDARFENQAPPSLRSMFEQRRRWMAGSLAEDGVLPARYGLLYGLRNLAWALSPVAPFLFLAPVLFPGSMLFAAAFRPLSFVLLAALATWSLIGWWYYRESVPTAVLLLVLTPLVTVLHAAGALYGVVSAPTDFVVTRKREPVEVTEDITE